MKKVLFYSFLVIFSACTSSKKIQKAQREINKPTFTQQQTVAVKPLVVAIKSRYLLKDSSIVKIYLEIEKFN